MKFMKLALTEAEKAGQKDEVPIGAILVDQSGNILARSHNQPISLSDPTAHAEIMVLRMACRKVMNYRLLNTTLYVTVEPCMMCMGAVVHARVARVIFGTMDSRWGAAGSLYDFVADNQFNHRPEILHGICEEECRSLIQEFFRTKRIKPR